MTKCKSPIAIYILQMRNAKLEMRNEGINCFAIYGINGKSSISKLWKHNNKYSIDGKKKLKFNYRKKAK